MKKTGLLFFIMLAMALLTSVMAEQRPNLSGNYVNIVLLIDEPYVELPLGAI
jgi:hypothetical protein